ncbi:hypothetical protein KX530_29420, partial [Escherichia coli]|nr:hypothetical protein [Escherichia coli]
LTFQNHTDCPLTEFGGKTSIFSHPVYLFLRKFSLQDSRGGSYGCGQWNMEHSMLVLESYGMDRFIADIEISRQFWRDGEHIISDILDYAAGAGFRDICADSGLNVKTAAQFRELLKFKNPAGVL